MNRMNKKLENTIRLFLAIVTVITNFSFIPNVFASTYKDYEIVEAKKEKGSLTNPGDVKLTKRIDYTDEDGVYKVTVTATGKNQTVTNSQTAKIYTVVAIDASSSMLEFDGLIMKYTKAKSGARSFARALLNKFGSTEIAAITYNQNVNVDREFKNKNLNTTIFTPAWSGTNTGGAISKATDMLLQKKNSDPNAKFYIVLLADGEPYDETVDYRTASNRAKNNGIEIFTIGYGVDSSGERVLKSIASKPEYYTSNKSTDIVDSFTNIVSLINPNYPAGTNAVLSDTIADGFEYVEGSATPGATVNGKVVSLTVNNITESGATLSFKIRAKSNLTNGIHNTNDSASIKYNNVNNSTKTLVLTESPKVNIEKYKYVVKYLEHGTDKVLSTQKTVNNASNGKTYTENAVQIDNYAVDANSKSVTINGGNAEIIFYYTKTNIYSYTVKYLEAGTNIPLANPEIRLDKAFGKTYTEDAIAIDGYTVDMNQKTVKIGTGTNEIIFYYTKRSDLSYTVKYLEDGANKPLADPETRTNKTFDEVYTEDAKAVDGYSVDKAQKTIKVGTGTNELVFYYTKRSDLSYTVKYLEEGTNKPLADPETRTNKTFDETYTENALTIKGYTVDKNQKTIKVGIGINEVIFYYTKKTDLTYVTEYYVEVKDGEGTSNQKISNDSERGNTVGGMTYGEEVLLSIINGDKYLEDAGFGYKSGVIIQPADTDRITIDDGDNIIKVCYYRKDDLSYTVKYLEKNTENRVPGLSDELRTNKTYLETYNETAKEAPDGYELADDSTKDITVNAENMVLVFHYSKKSNLTYTVKYLEEGTNKPLADPETRINKTFDEVYTEAAKAVDGYAVDKDQKTIKVGTGTNELVFYYTKRSDLSYTVKYLEQGTEKPLADSETRINKTFDETYTEDSKAVDGYAVDKDQKTIKVGTGTNELVFYYTKRSDLSYTVKYLEEGTNKPLADTETRINKTFDEVYTEDAKAVDGYSVDKAQKTIKVGTGNNELVFYYTKRTDLTYTVKYLEEGTNKPLADTETRINKTFDEVYTEDAKPVDGYTVDKNQKTIKIGTETNELVFYYTKRSDLSYTVKYLEQGTNKPLADSETRINKTFDEVYTEDAKAVDGYTVDKDQKTIKVGTGTNELVFYYTKRSDLSYTVKYLEQGTEKPLAEPETRINKTFDEVYTEDAKAVDGYTVDKNQKTIKVGTGTNELVFYYTKRTDLTYTVKYLEEGTNKPLANPETKTNKTFDETYTETALAIKGYTVDKEEKSVKVGTGTNEIIFYYTLKNDLTYRVEYYFDEVIDSSKTDYFEGFEYGTVITNYNDKLPEGYLFDRDTAPITIDDEEENVIKVYYVTAPEGDLMPPAPNTGIDKTNYSSIAYFVSTMLLVALYRKENEVNN